MRPGRARRLLLAAAAATPAACLGRGETARHVDTVLVSDTVVRVDTVLRIDTVIALGGIDGATLALEPGGVDTLVTAADLAYLRSRRLLVPVTGIAPERIADSFADARGSRRHHAVDIPAPRGTPVVAADSGWVLKLHTSTAGGLGIYATDPQRRFVYYYAHLDGYRVGLAEGESLARGDTIGYVGTTGNAPPTLPHLHFAIARMDRNGRWWLGTPIDPRPMLVATQGSPPAMSR